MRWWLALIKGVNFSFLTFQRVMGEMRLAPIRNHDPWWFQRLIFLFFKAVGHFFPWLECKTTIFVVLYWPKLLPNNFLLFFRTQTWPNSVRVKRMEVFKWLKEVSLDFCDGRRENFTHYLNAIIDCAPGKIWNIDCIPDVVQKCPV